MNNRLNIVATDNTRASPEKPSNGRLSRRLEIEGKYDRLWLICPERFSPERNAIKRNNLERAYSLITSTQSLEGKKIVDLGCGSGVMARRLRDAGASVDAVDISINALKLLKAQDCTNINAIQDFIPYTSLKDDNYDLVVSLGLIGDLHPKEHRLYFSELARLVKKDGFVVSSTSIDINTEGAIQHFGGLAETEFSISKWIFSYHALAIRIGNFLKAPERFARGSKDISYRQRQLDKRRNISKYWFNLNSSKIIGIFWRGVQLLTRPLAQGFMNSSFLINLLEKVCRTLQGESGISHILFIGERRPLIPPTTEELQAREPKQKRQVWE